MPELPEVETVRMGLQPVLEKHRILRAETRRGDAQSISFDDIASYQHSSVTDDVEFIIERMRQSGFDQIVVVDITRTDVAIPVVRVIVPRAEVWTLYFAHGDRASLGLRASHQIR